MIAPGMRFSAAGRVEATIGAAITPNFFNEGVGFMSNGDIAVDTDAPAGNVYRAGVRQSSAGAFYGTTSTAATDVYVGGMRISNLGQIVYEVADPTFFCNGNPFTAAGVLSLN